MPSPPSSYRAPLDSNLERELLAYTLDTGSELVRELKPLLFPIADNALQARQLFQRHEAECRIWREHVSSELARIDHASKATSGNELDDLRKENAELKDEGKRWRWLVLKIAAAITASGGSAGLGYFLGH